LQLQKSTKRNQQRCERLLVLPCLRVQVPGLT
jgi:hypothetical protein